MGRNVASSLLNSLISEDGIKGQTYSYDLYVFDSAFRVPHSLHVLWALNLRAQLQGGVDYVWDHDMSSPQLQSMWGFLFVGSALPSLLTDWNQPFD